MKEGYSIYRLRHLHYDVQNIIELMLFYNRIKNTNNEYRRVFYFFDTMWNYTCPNLHGRCVGIWQNVKIHWLDGQYHRNLKERGPAIEYLDGFKSWYVEGKWHREDGPAIEWANGDKEWYFHNQRHRLEGPAFEYANNDYLLNEYWEFGKKIIK